MDVLTELEPPDVGTQPLGLAAEYNVENLKTPVMEKAVVDGVAAPGPHAAQIPDEVRDGPPGGCSVYLHAAEIPIAAGDFAAMRAVANPRDRWAILPLMRVLGSRRRQAMLARASIGDAAVPISLDDVLPGLTGWRCLPTPGHTPGHLAYFRPEDRVLISGDALVTLQVNSLGGLLLQRPGLSGPPRYTTWNRQASETSLRMLARLEPVVLAGGHGIPVRGDTLADGLRGLTGRLGR